MVVALLCTGMELTTGYRCTALAAKPPVLGFLAHWWSRAGMTWLSRALK